MKYRNVRELIDPIKADPKRRANLERHRKEALREHVRYELAELRKSRGRTQVELAAALGVEQPTVSRTERRSSDPHLSTLRQYVEALGGHLEIAAVIDGERLVLDV